MQGLLGASLLSYIAVMFAIAVWSRSRVKNEEDYIVAGRRLPFLLSTGTLLATWFGAGTLLTASDKVRTDGLHVTALEPYGAGLCLILAGVFFAKPLWELKICTLPDLYRLRYGERTEKLAVLLTVPAFVGWVAVQLVALGGIIELFFHVPLKTAIVLTGLVGMLYTLIGGMWSVTLTDAVQAAFIAPGILFLGWVVFAHLGDGGVLAGFHRLLETSEPADLVLVPRESATRFLQWLCVLSAAALGNLPGQDLAQRIFSSRSASVARWSCIAAGLLYVSLGTVPILLGLAAKQLLPPEIEHSVLPALAQRFVSGPLAVLFTISVVSVVLSTLTTAILAPATMLARNLFRPWVPERVSTLRLCELCVALVSILGVVTALIGEDAYGILEQVYAIGLVGLLVPFVAAVFCKTHDERAALAAIFSGTAVWAVQFVVETTLPIDLMAAAAGAAVYGAVMLRRRAPVAGS